MSDTIRLTKMQTKIFLCDKRFIVVNCGRRAGKSFVMREIITYVSKQPNLKIYCLAPTLTQCKKLFFRPLLRIFRKIDNQLYKNESELYIELSNGTTLYFASEKNIDTVRGDDANFIFIDETRFFSLKSWEETLMPMLSRVGGRAFFFSTPGGKDGLHYELCIAPDDDTAIFNFTTLEGGLVSNEEIEKAKTKLDERSFKQEYEASFEAYSAAVCYNYSVNNYTDKTFSPTANTYLCFDFNATEKPYACIIIQEYDGIYYAVKEFVLKYTNTENMSQIVYDYLTKNNFKAELTIAGDHAGYQTRTSASANDYAIIGHYFKEMTGGKRPLTTPGRIRNRIGSLNSYIKNMAGFTRFYVNKTECPLLDRDLIRVEWAANGNELNGLNPDLTHALDAVSYLFVNLDKKPIDVRIY